MELAYKQDSLLKTISKWTALAICLYLCAIGLKTFHSYQLHKIISVNMASVQKASLITQMHNEMLLITRSHLQIMHASNEKQIKDQLWKLSGLISDYLIHYHQLEKIVDSSDEGILEQFNTGFEQWHEFNQNLLSYANVVADSDFINTLNMIDLAFSQFESNTDESLQLMAQLKQDISSDKVLSN
jgi:hypothetical protein